MGIVVNPRNPVDDVIGFKAYPKEWFTVGFIDDGGREKRVKELSMKRAQAAVDYPVSKGMDVLRIAATDGGANSVGDNETEPGRKEDHRGKSKWVYAQACAILEDKTKAAAMPKNLGIAENDAVYGTGIAKVDPVQPYSLGGIGFMRACFV
jgi:hypothetical protein